MADIEWLGAGALDEGLDPLTSVLGRRRQLTALQQRLVPGSTLAIVPEAAGVGSSHLAAVAARRSAMFPGGVLHWSMSLHGHLLAPVLHRFARGLNADPPAAASLDAQLAAFGAAVARHEDANGPTLWVLDDVCAADVARVQLLLAQRAPGTGVLVVADAAGAEGLGALPATLGPLSIVEALSVLRDAAGVSFPQNDAVALLEHAGGLPFAIHLFGMRHRLTGEPARSLVELGTRTAPLAAMLPLPDGPAAALAALLVDLPTSVQQGFRWLGAFARGQVSYEDLAGLAYLDPASARGIMARLADVGLVRVLDETHYTLTASLQRVAVALLDGYGDADEGAERHLSHVAQRVETLVVADASERPQLLRLLPELALASRRASGVADAERVLRFGAALVAAEPVLSGVGALDAVTPGLHAAAQVATRLRAPMAQALRALTGEDVPEPDADEALTVAEVSPVLIEETEARAVSLRPEAQGLADEVAVWVEAGQADAGSPLPAVRRALEALTQLGDRAVALAEQLHLVPSEIRRVRGPGELDALIARLDDAMEELRGLPSAAESAWTELQQVMLDAEAGGAEAEVLRASIAADAAAADEALRVARDRVGAIRAELPGALEGEAASVWNGVSEAFQEAILARRRVDDLAASADEALEDAATQAVALRDLVRRSARRAVEVAQAASRRIVWLKQRNDAQAAVNAHRDKVVASRDRARRILRRVRDDLPTDVSDPDAEALLARGAAIVDRLGELEVAVSACVSRLDEATAAHDLDKAQAAAEALARDAGALAVDAVGLIPEAEAMVARLVEVVSASRLGEIKADCRGIAAKVAEGLDEAKSAAEEVRALATSNGNRGVRKAMQAIDRALRELDDLARDARDRADAVLAHEDAAGARSGFELVEIAVDAFEDGVRTVHHHVRGVHRALADELAKQVDTHRRAAARLLGDLEPAVQATRERLDEIAAGRRAVAAAPWPEDGHGYDVVVADFERVAALVGGAMHSLDAARSVDAAAGVVDELAALPEQIDAIGVRLDEVESADAGVIAAWEARQEALAAYRASIARALSSRSEALSDAEQALAEAEDHAHASRPDAAAHLDSGREALAAVRSALEPLADVSEDDDALRIGRALDERVATVNDALAVARQAAADATAAAQTYAHLLEERAQRAEAANVALDEQEHLCAGLADAIEAARASLPADVPPSADASLTAAGASHARAVGALGRARDAADSLGQVDDPQQLILLEEAFVSGLEASQQALADGQRALDEGLSDLSAVLAARQAAEAAVAAAMTEVEARLAGADRIEHGEVYGRDAEALVAAAQSAVSEARTAASALAALAGVVDPSAEAAGAREAEAQRLAEAVDELVTRAARASASVAEASAALRERSAEVSEAISAGLRAVSSELRERADRLAGALAEVEDKELGLVAKARDAMRDAAAAMEVVQGIADDVDDSLEAAEARSELAQEALEQAQAASALAVARVEEAQELVERAEAVEATLAAQQDALEQRAQVSSDALASAIAALPDAAQDQADVVSVARSVQAELSEALAAHQSARGQRDPDLAALAAREERAASAHITAVGALERLAALTGEIGALRASLHADAAAVREAVEAGLADVDLGLSELSAALDALPERARQHLASAAALVALADSLKTSRAALSALSGEVEIDPLGLAERRAQADAERVAVGDTLGTLDEAVLGAQQAVDAAAKAEASLHELADQLSQRCDELHASSVERLAGLPEHLVEGLDTQIAGAIAQAQETAASLRAADTFVDDATEVLADGQRRHESHTEALNALDRDADAAVARAEALLAARDRLRELRDARSASVADAGATIERDDPAALPPEPDEQVLAALELWREAVGAASVAHDALASLDVDALMNAEREDEFAGRIDDAAAEARLRLDEVLSARAPLDEAIAAQLEREREAEERRREEAGAVVASALEGLAARRDAVAALNLGEADDASLRHISSDAAAAARACEAAASAALGASSGVEALSLAAHLPEQVAQLDEALQAAHRRMAAVEGVARQAAQLALDCEAQRVSRLSGPVLPDATSTLDEAQRWRGPEVDAALSVWRVRLRALSIWSALRDGTLSWLRGQAGSERDPSALAGALQAIATGAAEAWSSADARLQDALSVAKDTAHAAFAQAHADALSAVDEAVERSGALGAEAALAAEGWDTDTLQHALAALHGARGSLDALSVAIRAEPMDFHDAASVIEAQRRMAEAVAEIARLDAAAASAGEAAKDAAEQAREAAIAEAKQSAETSYAEASALAAAARELVGESTIDAQGFEGLDAVARSLSTVAELAEAAEDAAGRAEAAAIGARRANDLDGARSAAAAGAAALLDVRGAAEGQRKSLDALRRALREALRDRLEALSEEASRHIVAVRQVDDRVHHMFDAVRRPAVPWREHQIVDAALRHFDDARREVRAALETAENAKEQCERTASLGRAEAAVAAAGAAASSVASVAAELDAVCERIREAVAQAQAEAIAGEAQRRAACAEALADAGRLIDASVERVMARVEAWTLDDVLAAAAAVAEQRITLDHAAERLDRVASPEPVTRENVVAHAEAIDAIRDEVASVRVATDVAVEAVDARLLERRDAQLEAFRAEAQRALMAAEDAAVRASLFLGSAEAEAGPLAEHVFVEAVLSEARAASAEALEQSAALRRRRDGMLSITDVARCAARCAELEALAASAAEASARAEAAAGQVPGKVREAERDAAAQRAAADAAKQVAEAAQQAWDELELTIEAARSEFELQVASQARERWTLATEQADQVRALNEAARAAARRAGSADTRELAEAARVEAQEASDEALELSSSLLALLPELLDAHHAATRATRALLEARLEVSHRVVRSRQVRGQVMRAFRVGREAAAAQPGGDARAGLARLLHLVRRLEALGASVDAMHDAVQLLSEADEATQVAQEAREHVERMEQLAALAHASAVQIGRGHLVADVRDRISTRKRLRRTHLKASELVAISARGLTAAGAWLRAGQRWPEPWRDEPEVVSVAAGVVSGAGSLVDTWERVHQLAQRALRGRVVANAEAYLSRAADAARLATAASDRVRAQVDELGAVLRDAHARRVALRADMLRRRQEANVVTDQLQELMAPAALARRLALFEQGLRLARRRDDPVALRAWLVDTAEACAESGDLERARGLLAEASELAGAEGLHAEQAEVLRALARLDLRSGAPESALERINQALSVAPEDERDATRASLLAELGEAHLGLGDLNTGRALLTEALERAEFTGEVWLASAHHGRLARLESLDGRLDVATHHVERALAGFQAVGDRLSEGRELVRLSGLRLRQHRFLAALDLARMAAERIEVRGAPSLASLAAAAESAALRCLGRPTTALRVAERGIAMTASALPQVRNLLEAQRAAGAVVAARRLDVPDLERVAADSKEQRRRWRRGASLDVATASAGAGHEEAIDAVRDAVDGADASQRPARLALLLGALVDAGRADEAKALLGSAPGGGASFAAAVARVEAALAAAQP